MQQELFTVAGKHYILALAHNYRFVLEAGYQQLFAHAYHLQGDPSAHSLVDVT